MRYPEEMVRPMRQEMAQLGFEEARTPDAVRKAVSSGGTTLLFVNSVCGCAGGIARPGLALALTHGVLPDRLATTFAGMDIEAVDFARGLFAEYPPSSPQAALFKDGKPVEVIQRHQIEGTSAERFASLLTAAFDRHCRSGKPV
ncbi:MAG: BrxA/BrxB family bacilliredoxin [Candidatus Eiseniibacteriota bacterium]